MPRRLGLRRCGSGIGPFWWMSFRTRTRSSGACFVVALRRAVTICSCLWGDPKQAIYRFRGGDLATYLSARSRVDRIDVLEDNFRTTATLMEGLNRFMKPGLVRSGLPVPEVRACGKAEAPVGDRPLRVLVHPSPAALALSLIHI